MQQIENNYKYVDIKPKISIIPLHENDLNFTNKQKLSEWVKINKNQLDFICKKITLNAKNLLG